MKCIGNCINRNARPQPEYSAGAFFDCTARIAVINAEKIDLRLREDEPEARVGAGLHKTP